MECPYCKNLIHVKSGVLKDGTQKYRCLVCGKIYSSKTVVRPTIVSTCPSCASTNLVRAGKNKGVQRLLCKDCGKKFTQVKKERKTGTYKIECPRCKNALAIKNGKDNSGDQYYKCVSCKYKFLASPKLPRIPFEIKNKIIFYYVNYKTSKRQLSEYFKVSEKSVYNIIKKYLSSNI